MACKISIIIPAFNCEKVIDNTVKSIIFQDYSNWELILVDDGSTDSTRQLCDELSFGDKRIRSFQKEKD